MAELFFVLFAVVALFASVMVILMRNPVYSALWLVLVFVCVAGLYILLNAEFLAAVQIFVYAGGIMVLYLFVIMFVTMASPRTKERYVHLNWMMAIVFTAITLIAGAYLMSKTVYPTVVKPARGVSLEMQQTKYKMIGQIALVKEPDPTFVISDKESNTLGIGLLLYTKYLVPFEVASILLLVAMFGAIVLGAGRRFDLDENQDVENVEIASAGRKNAGGEK